MKTEKLAKQASSASVVSRSSWLLVDVSVMTVAAGFLTDGSQAKHVLTVAVLVACIMGLAQWRRRSRAAKPLTILLGLFGLLLCFLLGAGALAPLAEYDGPALTTTPQRVFEAAFVIVALNTGFVLLALTNVMDFDAGEWIGSEGGAPSPPDRWGQAIVHAMFLAGTVQFGAFGLTLATEAEPCTLVLVGLCVAVSGAGVYGAKGWHDRHSNALSFASWFRLIQVIGALAGAVVLYASSDPAEGLKQSAFAAIFAANLLLPIITLFGAEYVDLASWRPAPDEVPEPEPSPIGSDSEE